MKSGKIRWLGTGAFSSNNGQANFNTKYFDDYAGTIEIRQYGSHGKLHSIHTLNEAYPLIINPVTMNWAEDGAAKLGVTFAYKNYKCLYTKQDQPEKGFGFSVRLGDWWYKRKREYTKPRKYSWGEWTWRTN